MGTRNAWEYYFEQPMNRGLSDAYTSGNYIVSDISTMHEFLPYSEDHNCFQIDWGKSHGVLQPYQSGTSEVKESIRNMTNEFIVRNFEGVKVLGVHYRGTDKKMQVKDHFMAADLKSYIQTVKESMALKIRWTGFFCVRMKKMRFFNLK